MIVDDIVIRSYCLWYYWSHCVRSPFGQLKSMFSSLHADTNYNLFGWGFVCLVILSEMETWGHFSNAIYINHMGQRTQYVSTLDFCFSKSCGNFTSLPIFKAFYLASPLLISIRCLEPHHQIWCTVNTLFSRHSKLPIVLQRGHLVWLMWHHMIGFFLQPRVHFSQIWVVIIVITYFLLSTRLDPSWWL